MVVAELEDITYDLEVDGEQVRRTLHRKVFERGAWATVVIAFEQRGRDGAWQPAKLALVRLQRIHEAWKRHATITLRGDDALAIAGAVGGWSELAGDSAADEE